MIIFTYLALIVATIFAAYGRYRDIKSSSKFIHYGGKEGNFISKDKYGWFKTQFNVIGSAFLVIGLVVGGFITGSILAAGAVLIIVGIASLLIGINNDKNNKYMRNTFQIPTLRFLRDYNDFPNDIHLTPNLKWQDYSDRHFYRLFGWVYSTNKDEALAREEVNQKLFELSHKDEGEWFPK